MGTVLDGLISRGLDSSTVVILTADHGEEFNELNNGIHGHGSGYGFAQLQVPLVVAWPGRTPAVVSKRTSHFDIAPTIINQSLGCIDSSSFYSSGTDLFGPHQWEWIIAGSYFNYAVVEPAQLTVAYPNGFYEVRDRSFRLIDDPVMNATVLKKAYAEMGKFYRK